MPLSKILVIEDCSEMRKVLCDALSAEYEVESVGDAETAIQKINEVVFNLIIVDVGLPQMDGYKFCATLSANSKTEKTPIIIFSGRTDIEDKLIGFSLGASDYIPKPVDLRELRARVAFQIKNASHTQVESRLLTVGPFQANPVTQIITVLEGQQRIDLQLSFLEYRVFYFFLTHIDHVLSRQQLLDQIWGETRFVNDRNVDATISKLRQKMGAHSELLQSVRGAGYRFCKPTA